MAVNNILLIDDDRDTVMVYEILVNKLGYSDRFTSFYNAREALQYLDETDSFPNVLLVDINMDYMNGFEFVREFESRYLNAHPNTKVVFLSSSVRESDKIKALSYQCVDEFISKPLSNSKLSLLFQAQA